LYSCPAFPYWRNRPARTAACLTDAGSITSATNPDARSIPVDDLYFTRGVYGASWFPDGTQVLFTTNITGRPNLWKVSASGGWPLQLTQSDERQYNAVWSQDGKWIAYQQDTAGNELWDLFALPSDGGQAINLTNTPNIREESPRWSPDGRTIALNYKPKEGTSYNIALLAWNTRKVEKLTHETTPSRSWSSVAWSRDGKTLYANRFDISFIDSDIYAIDVATGTTTNLTPHQGNFLFSASSLSPDGKTLLVTSNQKGGYENVALLDLPSKKLSWVTDTQWEASSGDFSPDGKWFTYMINADGRTDLYLANRATRQGEKIAVPEGVNFLRCLAHLFFGGEWTAADFPRKLCPAGRLLGLRFRRSQLAAAHPFGDCQPDFGAAAHFANRALQEL
jgi:Tol biopolymer transport system component